MPPSSLLPTVFGAPSCCLGFALYLTLSTTSIGGLPFWDNIYQLQSIRAQQIAYIFIVKFYAESIQILYAKSIY